MLKKGNEICAVVDPGKIGKYIVEHNKIHFVQAKDAVFTEPWISSVIDPNSTELDCSRLPSREWDMIQIMRD